jgi:putative CocE/NonD family hydrolase
LHADGSLNARAATPLEPAATVFQFDPAHPVPTIGGGVSKRLKDGAYDQRERPHMPGSRPPYLPLRARNDVLVFQSEILGQDVVLAGSVEVTLYVSSTAADTDFTAKLIDVYPPSADFPTGFDMNLTDGIVRASYRDRSATRRLLTPGKIYRVVIRPFDTANVIKKGHRLRLDISSSNFPRFDVNPNTGEPLGMNRLMKTADNTVYHNANYPSAVKLYVMQAAP